jgi:MoaA/NifB/PqqE/SkfB family radical SAM enzyme
MCKFSLTSVLELEPSVWLDIFTFLKERMGAKFFTLTGGEPLLYDGLVPLIKGMEKFDYCVISSSFKPLFDMKKKALLDAGLKNWSVSLDVIQDLWERTLHGIDALHYFMDNGVKDLHCVVVVSYFNADDMLRFVKYLLSWGWWVEVTQIDWGKNEYYDLAPYEMKFCLPTLEQVKKLSQVFKELYNQGARLHSPDFFYDMWPKYRDCSYICKDPFGSLTIDADGTLRLCYRIKGVHLPKYTVFDLENKLEEVLSARDKDKELLCQGCMWNCVMMSDYFNEHPELDGESWFAHRVER